MLSLVNSGIRVVLIPAYARAIYHSQTATCKAVPASRLSVLCAERERSVLWLSRVSDPWSDQSMDQSQNTALGAEAGTRAASVHFLNCACKLMCSYMHIYLTTITLIDTQTLRLDLSTSRRRRQRLTPRRG